MTTTVTAIGRLVEDNNVHFSCPRCAAALLGQRGARVYRCGRRICVTFIDVRVFNPQARAIQAETSEMLKGDSDGI